MFRMNIEKIEEAIGIIHSLIIDTDEVDVILRQVKDMLCEAIYSK